MTQKTDIFSFLLKNPNARPSEISKKLKIKPESVRARLFELRAEKIVSKPIKKGKKQGTSKIRQTKQAKSFLELIKKIKPKPKPKEIEIEEEKLITIFKKTLGVTLYCQGLEKNFKAVLFESTEYPDREDELRLTIERFTNNDCGDKETKKSLGYEVEQWFQDEELGEITIEQDN